MSTVRSTVISGHATEDATTTLTKGKWIYANNYDKCKKTYQFKTRCKDDMVMSDIYKKAQLTQREARDSLGI